MGLFYSVPADLKNAESLVLAVGQQMSLNRKGYGDSEVLNEMIGEATREVMSARARLLAENRGDDFKRLQKHLLKVGCPLDTGAFNHVYRPWVIDLMDV